MFDDNGDFTLHRSRGAWLVVALAIAGACAPMMGDYLDGGESRITLVDEAADLTLVIEESDCAADGDGTSCDYDATFSGSSARSYAFTLSHLASGAIEVTEATDVGSGTSYGGTLEILPAELKKGETVHETDGANVFDLTLEDDDATATDLDGGEWTGCTTYAGALGRRGEAMRIVVCPTIGVVTAAFPERELTLVRQP